MLAPRCRRNHSWGAGFFALHLTSAFIQGAFVIGAHGAPDASCQPGMTKTELTEVTK
jgi:hypothetical protein